MQEPGRSGPKAADERRGGRGGSKANASAPLHYAFSLLSFCRLIYELQTGGAAGRRKRSGRRSEVEDRGASGSEKGKLVFTRF